jgi:hypothetical protein
MNYLSAQHSFTLHPNLFQNSPRCQILYIT